MKNSMPIATEILKKNLIASIEAKQRFLLQDDQLAVFDKVSFPRNFVFQEMEYNAL